MNRKTSRNDDATMTEWEREEINERTSYFIAAFFCLFLSFAGKKSLDRKRKKGNCSALIPGEVFFLFSLFSGKSGAHTWERKRERKKLKTEKQDFGNHQILGNTLKIYYIYSQIFTMYQFFYIYVMFVALCLNLPAFLVISTLTQTQGQLESPGDETTHHNLPQKKNPPGGGFNSGKKTSFPWEAKSFKRCEQRMLQGGKELKVAIKEKKGN